MTHSMNTWGRKKNQKKENIGFVLNLGSGRPSDMIQNMGVQKKYILWTEYMTLVNINQAYLVQ